MIGFPFFTILISNSAASIAYRGFALLVALMCLCKTGIRIVHVSTVRLFLIVLLYVSIQALIGVFLGEYASYPYPAVKQMFLMFNVGILWIPLLAFVTGFSMINWNKSVFYIFILLFITILHADLGTVGVEVSTSGRYDMGRLSTLAFGDNGSYLVLMATSLLATRKFWLTKYKIIVIILLVSAVLAGLFGVLKAGSRGPLVGCLFGWLFLVFCMQGRDRVVLLFSIVALIVSGAVSLAKLADFAPALYNRFVLTVEEGDTSGRDELFEEAFARFWVLRESYVKKTGEGLGAALTGLDFSDILGQKNSKGKKNGEFLEETFFEMEYDGYRIAICGEKDSKPEFVVYRGTIDNCFL